MHRKITQQFKNVAAGRNPPWNIGSLKREARFCETHPRASRINLYAASGNQAKEPPQRVHTPKKGPGVSSGGSRLCFILTPFQPRDAFKRETPLDPGKLPTEDEGDGHSGNQTAIAIFISTRFFFFQT